MASKSKIKGSNFEREFAKYLTENGIPAKRQVLSGSHPDHKGDVITETGIVFELKKRENINKSLWEWLENADYLVVNRNHYKPLVVMDVDRFIKLMHGIK